MVFSDFIGQEKIVNSLVKDIKEGKVSHAYMFEGPEGSGKATLAKIFAKALVCEDNNKPCNKCKSCAMCNSNSNPDIKIISSDSSILIESTREIIKDIYIKPLYGKKVYIIEDMDKMTPSAQNSLLKTLEEPPEYAVFILTTKNINVLLPTIVSRCIIKKFERCSIEEVNKYILKNCEDIKEDIGLVASLSNGLIGNVTKIIDPEFKVIRENILRLTIEMITKSKTKALENAKILTESKYDIDVQLNIMISFLRDILILKEFNNNNLIINKDYINEILKISQKISKTKIESSIMAVLDANNSFMFNGNLGLTLENLSLKMNAN